jgi:hypothetical protein
MPLLRFWQAAHIIALWVLLGWLLAGGSPASAQGARELDLKAVFLFNFIQFVDWPADAFPEQTSPYIIGILGTDPFKSSLDAVVKDEIVRDRKVIVRRFTRVEDVGTCHVLYISNSEARHLDTILVALRGRPVLTVSDSDQFAFRGGMIRLYTEKTKVRLRINNEAARAAHLGISSKLLRVAEVVSPAAPE